MIVARNILLAERTGGRVHCQHISAADSVRLLREAHRRGVRITAEACPHHFTLTDAALAGSDSFWREDGRGLLPATLPADERPAWPAYDTNFKMNPPLRTARDRAAVLEGIADGTIEILASDHAPHCNYEKEVEFDYAPFGITGLETELALALMRLYHSGLMPLANVIERFTTGPARLLKLAAKGTLAVGDATGFYVPEKDAFWPNYFVSLADYLDSIRKMATLPAKRAVLSHNCVLYGNVREHLHYAMSATEKYHKSLLSRLESGESAEKIAIDMARFVDGITDIQPFRVMYDLSKLLIHRSQKADPGISFSLE